MTHLKLKISEKDVQRTILDWLAAKKIFHYRQNSGAMQIENRFMRFGAQGAPDIVAVIRGRYVGIECKGSSGRQSQAQRDFETALRKAGGEYVLARSSEDVEKAIKAITKND